MVVKKNRIVEEMPPDTVAYMAGSHAFVNGKPRSDWKNYKPEIFQGDWLQGWDEASEEPEKRK